MRYYVIASQGISGVLQAGEVIETIHEIDYQNTYEQHLSVCETHDIEPAEKTEPKRLNEQQQEISRYQFVTELRKRNLHDAVMNMLNQLAQSEQSVADWIETGTNVQRYSAKVEMLAGALEQQGHPINLDDFFIQAKRHSL